MFTFFLVNQLLFPLCRVSHLVRTLLKFLQRWKKQSILSFNQDALNVFKRNTMVCDPVLCVLTLKFSMRVFFRKKHILVYRDRVGKKHARRCRPTSRHAGLQRNRCSDTPSAQPATVAIRERGQTRERGGSDETLTVIWTIILFNKRLWMFFFGIVYWLFKYAYEAFLSYGLQPALS